MANSKLFCALFVGALSLGACSKKGDAPEAENASTASNDTTTTTVTQDPMASSEPTTSGADTASLTPGPVGGIGGTEATGAIPAPQTAPLTDAQIVKVAETVDMGEIEQAKEVQKKAKNAQVKKLAAHMISQHTKSKNKGASLAKKADLTPEESAVSTEISSKGAAALESIKTAAAPADAERAYIDAQVQQHETVLELINTRLLPSAVNADLKAQLEETRSMVEKHIEEARKVQQALSADVAPPAPAG